MSDLLLVDNDRRIVELVAFFLEKRGHAVRRAESYRAARTALEERPPDLMLADLELGAERGEEEIPRLASAGLLPPTLIVSGYLDAGTEQRLCAIAGVLGTLRKPFDLALLEKRIESALEAASALVGGGSVAHAKEQETGAVDADGWVDIRPLGSRP